jgi:hypothetical protein
MEFISCIFVISLQPCVSSPSRARSCSGHKSPSPPPHRHEYSRQRTQLTPPSNHQRQRDAGADTVDFDIPGAAGSVRTLTLLTQLPDITDAIRIDGYTQPGSSANTLAAGDDALPLVELSGNNLVARGFKLETDDSTVRGLVINRFILDGITIGPDTNSAVGKRNSIVGNFIGTDADGATDLGNGDDG